MDKKSNHQGGLAKPFGDAAAPADNELHELVKLMARIAADKDYKEVLEKSKTEYTACQKKGRNP